MSLIIHPEVNKLKEQLTQRIYEYDNLVNHVCPEIERRYVLEFGLHEYKLYSLELEIDKLRRKLHLIQIEINHENEINMDEIDKIIAKEFEEYDKQVQAQIDEINFIKENNPEKLSESDSKKLKKIYRCLVKRLHPDLNPKYLRTNSAKQMLDLSYGLEYLSGKVKFNEVIKFGCNEHDINRYVSVEETKEAEERDKFRTNLREKVEIGNVEKQKENEIANNKETEMEYNKEEKGEYKE